jgi:hypothetical protein
MNPSFWDEGRWRGMKRFNFADLEDLKRIKGSPSIIKAKIDGLLTRSENCNANIENIDPKTGEYRIVLQGTVIPEKMTQPQ